ncbi:hypothetical protein VCX83_19520 [Aeromonas caviae]|uniref:hypothetical protein n=1 Tax=Aeromonas caviae TaxID=648 RepID=UPI002B24D337|nr:hypothetical protein [Aeromonas caviae]MEA9424040.1 hypothetical protein [Aeromonas caviae]
MFGSTKQEMVVSETDIEAALDHLRTLPYRAALPVAWDRQRLLNQLREAIGQRPKIDQCHGVAPGVFAIVKPFGVDLVAHGEPDGRLQVWLLIRPCGTDPSRITRL